jgi:hypothetical protein
MGDPQRRMGWRGSLGTIPRNRYRRRPLVGKGTEYEFEDEYDFGAIARMEKLSFARSERHAMSPS